MKIEILGTGCAKCKKLYENARQAVKDLDVNAEVVKVEDIQDIMNAGVMMIPALAVDGDVKSTGKLLGVDDIKKILTK